jgi:SPP1 family predicted phage head-tail adaptor
MRAGKMDRRVSLQRWTETGRDPLNQPVYAWVEIAEVWAQQRPVRGGERMAAQQQSGDKMMGFHIRYRTDLSVKDRVVFEGVSYEIQDLRELGRRVVTEIDAVGVAD